MKIHKEFQQRSMEWMLARAGKPTASEFDALITPEWKLRTGQSPHTYLAKKLAEAWLGGPLPGFNTFDMEQGSILEDEALPWYELEYGQPIDRVGLITTDDGRIACSPDGLLGDDSGIEIKCPEPHTHVGYLIGGGLPPQYAAQVHGALLVSGRPIWRFVSYCRRFPALVVTVQRDEKIIARLQQAIDVWLERFDAGWAKLVEANGGPPNRSTPRQEQEAFVSEMPS